MPVATANGKKFTFPAGTTPEQMGAAIDEYFAKTAPQEAPSAESPTSPAAPGVPPTEEDFLLKTTPQSLGLPVGGDDAALSSAIEELPWYKQSALAADMTMDNLVRGAQQIYHESMGNTADVDRLRQEEQESRRVRGPLGDTAGGMGGEVLAGAASALPLSLAASAAAPEIAGGGLLAALARIGIPIASEGLQGAAMGALQGTAREGERGENAAVGGAMGAAMPALGSAFRGLTGYIPEGKAAAAKALERMGVKVPYSDTLEGGLPAAPGLLTRYLPNFAPEADQSKTLVNAQKKLFEMLGTEMPSTLQDMKGISKEVGERLGQRTVGVEIPTDQVSGEISDILARYSEMAGTLQKKKVFKLGEDIMDMTDGGTITGREYAMNRKEMARAAAKAGGEAGRKMQEMVEVLDESVDKAVGPRVAQELATDREKYRMALALKNANVKDGKIKSEALLKPLSKIFGSRTNDEALAMLQQADKLKTTVGGQGLLGSLLRTPAQFSRPASRKTVASVIRGVNQSINQEED